MVSLPKGLWCFFPPVSVPSWELTQSPFKDTFEDDFPFPRWDLERVSLPKNPSRNSKSGELGLKLQNPSYTTISQPSFWIWTTNLGLIRGWIPDSTLGLSLYFFLKNLQFDWLANTALELILTQPLQFWISMNLHIVLPKHVTMWYFFLPVWASFKLTPEILRRQFVGISLGSPYVATSKVAEIVLLTLEVEDGCFTPDLLGFCWSPTRCPTRIFCIFSIVLDPFTVNP